MTEASSAPVSELVSSVAFVEEVVAMDTLHRRGNAGASSRWKSSDDEQSLAKQVTSAARRSGAVADTAQDSLADALVAAKSIADEMVELDAEIDALRSRLAKKLSVQNDYLRKLLMRYDGK